MVSVLAVVPLACDVEAAVPVVVPLACDVEVAAPVVVPLACDVPLADIEAEAVATWLDTL